MILVKEGVRFRKLLPEIYNCFPIIDLIFAQHGVEAVITSANDSTHMQGSFHYVDKAIDLRTNHLEPGEEPVVTDELRQALGLDYQVLLENLNTTNEHIHVAYRGM